MSTGIFPQFMHSGQINAPQMGEAVGAEGQILQVLDACLITGFAPLTASSVVIDGDNLKIVFGVAHGYELHQFIKVEGATSAAFNGKHRIVAKDTTSISIAKGLVTDTSGLIKVKVSPLDWENIFGTSDSKRRAYRSKDVTSTRSVLYLDCNYPTQVDATNPAKLCKVNVCTDMVVLGEQIGSHTASYEADFENGASHWAQAVGNSFSARVTNTRNSPWAIVGDGKFFYFFVDYYSSATTGFAKYMFGDTPKLSNNDNYNCLVGVLDVALQYSGTHALNTSAALNSAGLSSTTLATRANGLYYIRDILGRTIRDYAVITGLTLSPTNNSGLGGAKSLNPLNFGLPLSELSVWRYGDQLYAGKLPYLRNILVDSASLFTGSPVVVSNSLLVLRMATANPSQQGFLAVDLFSERPQDENV